jgi:hypothetical protein
MYTVLVQGGVDSIWDWLGRATRGGDPCTKRHGADSFKDRVVSLDRYTAAILLNIQTVATICTEIKKMLFSFLWFCPPVGFVLLWILSADRFCPPIGVSAYRFSPPIGFGPYMLCLRR